MYLLSLLCAWVYYSLFEVLPGFVPRGKKLEYHNLWFQNTTKTKPVLLSSHKMVYNYNTKSCKVRKPYRHLRRDFKLPPAEYITYIILYYWCCVNARMQDNVSAWSWSIWRFDKYIITICGGGRARGRHMYKSYSLTCYNIQPPRRKLIFIINIVFDQQQQLVIRTGIIVD